VHNFADAIRDDLANALAGAEQITLVHNAALLINDNIAETESEQLRRVLEINIVAASSLNQLLIPKMGTGSAVLYVGSTLGEKAVPNSFTYATSKHAVVGMMRATCQDLAGSGVHTACISPGFTNTEMLREHVPADVMPQIAAMSAFERLIEPDEIAKTLLFAAQNPVLNGATINANLGQIER
jgi:NAD(P)-dependent dehydrogenase (short-subunit alcohol dehydrogenase family)